MVDDVIIALALSNEVSPYWARLPLGWVTVCLQVLVHRLGK